MELASAEPLARARTALGWGVVRRLLEVAPTENVFVSPHSLAGALAVAQAAGVVEAQSIGRLLGSDDPSSHAQLTAALADPDPEAIEMRTAQSLWTDLRLGFREADAVREHFPDVEWRARAFADPATVAEMNAWASEATDGMIDTVVDELRESEVLAVLDAILFFGTWAHKFDRERTRPAPFRTAGRGDVDVSLMQVAAKLDYAEDEGWQAVRLPYGWGRIGLVIVLPAADVPLADFARGFEWDAALSTFANRDGAVQLPRFRLDAIADLLEHLRALGLAPPDVAIEEGRLRISRVSQHAVLEVDEEGTRAAAVTFLAAEITSLGPPPFEFTADRPFLCAIHDRDTGSLLFVGAVQDPEPITE